jgi:hypothetical protein
VVEEPVRTLPTLSILVTLVQTGPVRTTMQQLVEEERAAREIKTSLETTGKRL